MAPMAIVAGFSYALEPYANLGGPVLYAVGNQGKLIITAVLSGMIMKTKQVRYAFWKLA